MNEVRLSVSEAELQVKLLTSLSKSAIITRQWQINGNLQSGRYYTEDTPFCHNLSCSWLNISSASHYVLFRTLFFCSSKIDFFSIKISSIEPFLLMDDIKLYTCIFRKIFLHSVNSFSWSQSKRIGMKYAWGCVVWVEAGEYVIDLQQSWCQLGFELPIEQDEWTNRFWSWSGEGKVETVWKR
jgi:hypothetical protein